MESVVSSLIGSCCGKDCHEWNTERGSRQTYVAGGSPIIPYHSALDDTRDSLLARLRSRGNERHKAQQHGQLHLTRYTTFGLVAGLDETINTFVRPKVLDPDPVGFTFVAVKRGFRKVRAVHPSRQPKETHFTTTTLLANTFGC